MNGTFSTVKSGLLLLAVSTSLTAQVIELDLRKALERAPEANFQILLSQERILAGQESTVISRSALLPQVSLEASQARSMNPTVDAFANSFPGIPKRFFNDRFDAVLRTRLSLLDFRNYDDWNISKLDLAATKLQVENTVQEVLRQISIAYITHWRNERRLKVIDANLERDRLLLKIAQDQKDAGVATELDVTRAEVRLASNELARIQQETAVMDSALSLKRILNYPLGATLAIQDPPIEMWSGNGEYNFANFERILRNRPDYQQMEAELERESLSFRATKRDRLPSLAVTGDWGYASQSWSDPMKEQWSIALGLSMPVFEGFRINAQQQRAASFMRQKEIELENLRLEIESQYRLALQTLQSAARQVEVSKRALSLNEREFELARIRFEEGVADNSDVVDAQAALADAEDGVVEAEYRYIQAKINLARTEGNVRGFLN